MKTVTKIKKDAAYWGRVLESTRQILPRVKSELEDGLTDLKLKECVPMLTVDKFPPRISLSFGSGNKARACEEIEVPEIRDELQKYQEQISLAVEKVADSCGLQVRPGLIIGAFVGVRGRRTGRYQNKMLSGLGWYTFNLNYNDFGK
jgi:hypothetical protein